MLNLSVKVSGITETRAFLTGFQKQLPFATAKALTKTAQQTRDELKAQIQKDLDRPTPFTIRGISIRSATKANQQSLVYIKDIQAEYLFYSVEGGLAGRSIQPANVRLNKYGNIPRRALKKLLARPDVFYGTIRGITGIWQRGRVRGEGFTTEVKSYRGARGQTGYKYKAGNIYRNVRLIAKREQNVRYKKRFDFYGGGERKVNRVWQKNMDDAINFALKTAR